MERSHVLVLNCIDDIESSHSYINEINEGTLPHPGFPTCMPAARCKKDREGICNSLDCQEKSSDQNVNRQDNISKSSSCPNLIIHSQHQGYYDFDLPACGAHRSNSYSGLNGETFAKDLGNELNITDLSERNGSHERMAVQTVGAEKSRTLGLICDVFQQNDIDLQSHFPKRPDEIDLQCHFHHEPPDFELPPYIHTQSNNLNNLDFQSVVNHKPDDTDRKCHVQEFDDLDLQSDAQQTQVDLELRFDVQQEQGELDLQSDVQQEAGDLDLENDLHKEPDSVEQVNLPSNRRRKSRGRYKRKLKQASSKYQEPKKKRLSLKVNV